MKHYSFYDKNNNLIKVKNFELNKYNSYYNQIIKL